MHRNIKNILKNIINSVVDSIINTRIGSYILSRVIGVVMERVVHITHDGCNLAFTVPNPLCEFRVKTFSTKEPETLEWIDSIKKDSIFWDIGANIGLYSIYAAKKRNCNVWSFEPSIFNLELLARNIFINGLSKNICIVPIPLSDKFGINQMQLTTTEWGGALSTFGRDFGWDGKKIRKIFEFRTVGLSMEDMRISLQIPQPDYIKIDVDGLEHFILSGGSSILLKVKQVLIEVNDDFHEQAEKCHFLLSNAGLVLKDKKHSDYIASNNNGFQNSYNQIWSRP